MYSEPGLLGISLSLTREWSSGYVGDTIQYSNMEKQVQTFVAIELEFTDSV